MNRDSIDAQARLIAALAETMNDRMWAADILRRCEQIQEAVREIQKTAQARQAGER